MNTENSTNQVPRPTSLTSPSDWQYFVDFDEDHPDVFIVMECGCTTLKIIMVDSDLVTGSSCTMFEVGDVAVMLYNRHFVELTMSLIERALEGTNAEDYHVQRGVGAFASHSVLTYERMKHMTRQPFID